ncbi:MAG: dephospho-CoA kinase [Phycisphaerales bacterium]
MTANTPSSPSTTKATSERVIYDDRPHPVFIITESWRWIVFGILIWGLLIWIDGQFPGYFIIYLAWSVLVLVLLRIVYAGIDRAVRIQRMTDARVVAKFGILSTVQSEIALHRVQHLVVARTLVERIFGIGSIGISSAGTGNVELVWRGVEKPDQVRQLISETVERIKQSPAHTTLSTARSEAPSTRASTKMSATSASRKSPLVIGLVGGIGSGKSTVARAFEDIGCVVSDSDKAGAVALSMPEVIRELVAWWGDEILSKDGQVDRKKVATIVFADPQERTRLEKLVHPIIHDLRHEMIEKAQNDTAIRAVIVDAPLLFEAGIEDECDAVVFVQTPMRIRSQRVQETRGWDESELDRREKAQLPLEHKRERADYIVANGGSVDELPAQVARILHEIEESQV